MIDSYIPFTGGAYRQSQTFAAYRVADFDIAVISQSGDIDGRYRLDKPEEAARLEQHLNRLAIGSAVAGERPRE